ncbi:cystathionine gamma-synthase [Flavobacteriales bacterium]|jgi:cystathionine beta-lyase|nr:cystathionine gamma-synthase [Flavobacteriales bacterium]MDA7578249.1 cystathionine gamma-synthase [Flavobacteriales bacterium]MDA7596177.1 cystathionine gamma-synthase [Flavobacteriales bacterium]MDC0908610.1 cystathionine gamma-synthase [Flavobacteriales bacterium]MDC3390703.1 cystathionine gamma-synthase [Flavobacteriales bacterium]
MKFGTKTIHAGQTADPTTGAIMTPIYQTSTYIQKSPGDHKGYEYSRTGNPTRNSLEKNIASLENGKHGLCFGSGLAAVDAIIKLLSPGDEVISTNDLYGGTYRIFTKVFENFGIKFHFVGMENISNLDSYINGKTKMIWAETPTNPMLNIIDIKALSIIAKKNKLTLVVDNTFATPFLQRPLDLGADIVMHSLTKYMGGHSDVVMGAAICKDDAIAEKLFFIQNSCGAVPGPMDSFLVLRGIKTLHIRMQRHCENGKEIATFLNNHPKVDKVYWPGLKTHPNYSVAKNQMDDFGGMISFNLIGNNLNDAITVVSNTNYFTLAESLGGVESLCGHPASMTHAAIPKAEREKTGVVDSLIRLSVGIEDINDLINDLEQALSKI